MLSSIGHSLTYRAANFSNLQQTKCSCLHYLLSFMSKLCKWCVEKVRSPEKKLFARHILEFCHNGTLVPSEPVEGDRPDQF